MAIMVIKIIQIMSGFIVSYAKTEVVIENLIKIHKYSVKIHKKSLSPVTSSESEPLKIFEYSRLFRVIRASKFMRVDKLIRVNRINRIISTIDY
jgi:hypothetical protein